MSDDDDDDLPDPGTIPLDALDEDGWKALALAWKRRADEEWRKLVEAERIENERRAGLGLEPLPSRHRGGESGGNNEG